MSEEHGLPPRVAAFLTRHINSVAELEALLLARTQPADAWRAATLAQRLYVSEATAGAVLESLRRHGLLARRETGYGYAPEFESLREDVEELAAAYPRFLIRITHLIHGRSRGARDFAEAFRLREEED
jgi:hypothetical protein